MCRFDLPQHRESGSAKLDCGEIMTQVSDFVQTLRSNCVKNAKSCYPSRTDKSIELTAPGQSMR